MQAWVGGEGTANVWSIYSGLTWAPLGSIDDRGLRVRLSGGSGQYHYTTTITGSRTTVRGSTSFGDVLAGYQTALGPLTIKLFGGGTLDAHVLTPFDPANPIDSRLVGAKGVFEAWLNMAERDWISLDLSWATAHDAYYSRLRLGHRLTPVLSVGVEAGAYGNQASDNGRAGGFMRYEWAAGDVSASGGVSGDIAKPATPYATLAYTSKF